MKSFIIIEHEPLTERLKQIWNIDALREREVHVEYWDISKCVYPQANIPMTVEDNCVKRIGTIEEFEKNLINTDIKNSVFVSEFYWNWNNRKIILLLNEHQCYCVKIDLYANTILPSSFANRAKYKLESITLKKIEEKIKFRLFLKVNSIKKSYNKILSSSTYTNPDIFINHPDYELFNQINSSSNKENSYILFIDTYYPLHPDIQRISNKTANVEYYRKLMNKFFDFVENKYSKKVIIAAHPKAIYNGTEFGRRKIFWGKTAELIKHANFVFMHGSNSLSFIALADKPFAIVYPESFKMYPYMYKQIINLAKYCDKTAYNLDNCNWDSIVFSKWDNKLRKKYIYSFLTSEETSKKQNVDIWIEKLLNQL